jgi:hypothetical protein
VTSSSGGRTTGAASTTGTRGVAATAIDQIALVAAAEGWTVKWQAGIVRLRREGGGSVVVAYSARGEIKAFALGGQRIRAKDKLPVVLSALLEL